jgi:hypothetical protein
MLMIPDRSPPRTLPAWGDGYVRTPRVEALLERVLTLAMGEDVEWDRWASDWLCRLTRPGTTKEALQRSRGYAAGIARSRDVDEPSARRAQVRAVVTLAASARDKGTVTRSLARAEALLLALPSRGAITDLRPRARTRPPLSGRSPTRRK